MRGTFLSEGNHRRQTLIGQITAGVRAKNDAYYLPSPLSWFLNTLNYYHCILSILHDEVT